MNKVIELICTNVKIYTAVQFGFDLNLDVEFINRVDNLVVFDKNCDWAWKCIEEIAQMDEEWVLDYELFLEEKDLPNHMDPYETFDMAYISNRGSKTYLNDVLLECFKMKVPYIITNPAVPKKKSVAGYNRVLFTSADIYDNNNEYVLYYQDIIARKLREANE